MPLLRVVRKGVRFPVEMPQLLVRPFTALGIAQRTRDKPHVVEPVHDLGCGIGDVLALLYFEAVGVFSDGFVEFLCLCLVGGREEGFPKVGDAEDEVVALEGWCERCWVVEVGGDNLDAFATESFGGQRTRCAG